MDNLPELRDIHLPTHDVSMWPLANGWWALLVAIILLYALGKALFWLRRQSAKIYARHLLNGLDMQNYIKASAKMSEILLKYGVTSFIPTLYATPKAKLLKACRAAILSFTRTIKSSARGI